jgi:hypothetical protein
LATHRLPFNNYQYLKNKQFYLNKKKLTNGPAIGVSPASKHFFMYIAFIFAYFLAGIS